MDPLVLILACLTLSFLLSKLFSYIRIPGAIGSVLVGIVLSIPFISSFLSSSDLSLLERLSDIGIMFLMFYIGLKFDLVRLSKNPKAPILIGLLSFFACFVAVSLASYYIFHIGLVASLLVGLAISLTSDTIIMTILNDNRKINSGIGRNIIGSSLLHDAIGFIIILLIIPFIRSADGLSSNFILVLFDILIFLTVIYLVRYLVFPVVLQLIEKRSAKIDLFVISLMIVFLLAVASSYLGVSSILGALLAGIIVRHTLLSGSDVQVKEEKEVTGLVEVAVFGFLAPFFFIWIGLNFHLSSLFGANIFFVLCLIVFAFAAKFIGSFIGAVSSGISVRESFIIGIGMNVRGEMDLVIAALAFSAGLLSESIFSAFVVASLFLTLFCSVLFKLIISARKNSKA